MNLKLKKFYAITDRKQFKYDFETQIKRMLDKGIRMFQLREKDLSAGDLLKLSIKMRELLDRYGGATLIINDRVDVAFISGADGVHLPSNGLPVSVVKERFPDLIVGKSCHSLEEAIQSQKDGADYITFSPIFETPNKGKPKGLSQLEEVVKRLDIPVYALGGINEDNMPSVFDTGAYGVAGIRLFID
ncbi:MAG: thiamine phosphate synthase [Aquificae bacterium]|nr:thiamine phosphate synthase [Aquificota bacterium]